MSAQEGYVTRQEWRQYIRNCISGYLILAVGVIIGLFFSGLSLKHTSEARKERAALVTHYFRQQCTNDKNRDAVLIRALQDAIQRAEKSINDPIARNQAVLKLVAEIDDLKKLEGNCVKNIPPI